MIIAKPFFLDCKRTLVQPLRLCVLARFFVYETKIAQRSCGFKIAIAKFLFLNSKRALKQLLGFDMLTLQVANIGEIVESFRNMGIIFTEAFRLVAILSG